MSGGMERVSRGTTKDPTCRKAGNALKDFRHNCEIFKLVGFLLKML